MKILVVGSGAREDALSWRLGQSPSCSALYACPGNAGTLQRGENWPDLSVTDGKSIAARARERGIDLVVLGPETAIAAGVGDRLRDAGIATFGPGRAAGRLESSKVFAKQFMQRHGSPTARARIVRSLDAALKACDGMAGGVVVKADGLAAGKGVVVAASRDHAEATLREWFGRAGVPGGGSEVLLEERLSGPEVSVFAIGDGRSFVPFAAACDYKRRYDGDAGPNTGGMGAYSPPAGFPADLDAVVAERILGPVLAGLQAEGERYVGVLYCGLMWTATGPKVIEFNVRFGDPETQALLPRLRSDLLEALVASTRTGGLAGHELEWSPQWAVSVVLASAGYPESSSSGDLISGLEALPGDVEVTHAGTARRDGELVTAGGRVLNVTGLGADAQAARDAAYAAADMIEFPGRQLRRDIAERETRSER
jgi:phosphoribosylamine--glycine ligase